MTSARPTRSRRSHPAARRMARAARIADASTPYAGTLTIEACAVSGIHGAAPRNLHMRSTVRALASEFSTERPIYNTRGDRIG